MALRPANTPKVLHYTAALIYLATIPKHTLVGMNQIRPAAATVPNSHKVKKLITPTWFYCNLYLVMSALLSARWARTGGPSSKEEKAIVWAQLLVGAVVGWEYYRNKMFVGLGVLWAAPVASVVAMIQSEV